MKKRPRNTEYTDSDIEDKFRQLQTPIYSKEQLSNEEILSLLTDTDSIEMDKVRNFNFRRKIIRLVNIHVDPMI